jgi:hypothetical protein
LPLVAPSGGLTNLPLLFELPVPWPKLEFSVIGMLNCVPPLGVTSAFIA